MESLKGGYPQIVGYVGGQAAARDIDGLELQSARRALRLLKARLTADEMDRLLRRDLDESDARWRHWAANSDGSWRASEVDFKITGLTKAQFTEWWSTALDDLPDVVFPAFPEHYRFGWVDDPRRVADRCYLVVEELGHVPFRMYATFDSGSAPIDPLPGYEVLSAGVGRLADGTEVARFMTQVKELSSGFALRTGLYFVSAATDDVVQSHIDQLLVEWTRWFEMAILHFRPVLRD